MNILFAVYHPYYDEKPSRIKSIHDPFLWLLFQLLLLTDNLSDYVDKFAIYHLHCEEKPRIINSTYNSYLYYSSHKLKVIASIY